MFQGKRERERKIKKLILNIKKKKTEIELIFIFFLLLFKKKSHTIEIINITSYIKQSKKLLFFSVSFRSCRN